MQKHILQDRMLQEVAYGYRDLQQVCTQHGTCIDCAPVTDSQQLQRFQCSTCPASFTTPQGLSAHRWRMHQEISLERQYVFSSTCAACGKCFWTAQRLQRGQSDITGVLELADVVDKGPIILNKHMLTLPKNFPWTPCCLNWTDCIGPAHLLKFPLKYQPASKIHVAIVPWNLLMVVLTTLMISSRLMWIQTSYIGLGLEEYLCVVFQMAPIPW